MSLSSTLSNALSGLTASARGASVISSNLANVLTEGYAVRDLSLSARSAGADGGVTINGVTRLVDMALVQDRRLADAELANANTRAGYLDRLTVLAGDPTSQGSLTGLLAELDASLITAASLPESETRLSDVLRAAQGLAHHLNDLSSGVQTLRAEAERSINTQVTRLNQALHDVERLNRDIVSAGTQGRETAGLMDQRQRLIDEISGIVPVKELARDMGTVALISDGGKVLLDGQAAEISFVPRNTVAAHMTVENELLSGVLVNGMDISAADGKGLGGGSLGAHFTARDAVLPTVQAELDTVALDLMDRFGAGLDPSVPAGAPGLFTDEGGAFTDLVGLAGRIDINAAADPGQSGNIWRIRDGLGAVAPGNTGDGSLLQAMHQALSEIRSPSADALGTAQRNATVMMADFLSAMGQRETQMDRDLSFASARQSELLEMEQALGVDSDSELQKLMLIEQAYAANAKMIQAVDQMLQQLMEIG